MFFPCSPVHYFGHNESFFEIGMNSSRRSWCRASSFDNPCLIIPVYVMTNLNDSSIITDPNFVVSGGEKVFESKSFESICNYFFHLTRACFCHFWFIFFVCFQIFHFVFSWIQNCRRTRVHFVNLNHNKQIYDSYDSWSYLLFDWHKPFWFFLHVVLLRHIEKINHRFRSKKKIFIQNIHFVFVPFQKSKISLFRKLLNRISYMYCSNIHDSWFTWYAFLRLNFFWPFPKFHIQLWVFYYFPERILKYKKNQYKRIN